MRIFIVVGGVNYEGSSPLRAFVHKGEAKEFAAKCSEYDRTRPEFTRDDPQGWIAAEKAWREAHPCGEDATVNDYYRVVEVELVGAGTAAEWKGASDGR